ncbi:MAG: hypothetical protein WAV18_22700 [Roseiarcus sp.]
MVRKSVLALALFGGALHLGGAAQASVADGLVSGTAPRVSQVQFAQFNPLDIPGAIVGGLMFGGHNYCWYDDGWSGPGYYWCGYGYYNGYGYGGGEGWHGWREHRHWEGQEHGHGGEEHHGGGDQHHGGGDQHHGGGDQHHGGGDQHHGGGDEHHDHQ